MTDIDAALQAGMASLIARSQKQSRESVLRDMPPEIREVARELDEAEEHRRMQKARDIAFVAAWGMGPGRYWWIFTSQGQDEAGLEWRETRTDPFQVLDRIVDEDPTPFELFRKMDKRAQINHVRKMQAAGMPPSQHPWQLHDLVTGEFRPVQADPASSPAA